MRRGEGESPAVLRARHVVLSVMVVLGCLGGAGNAGAKVRGPCSNCHTMHNSQNGAAIMTFNLHVGTVSKQGPLGQLLRSDCVGCHTNASGSDTIVDLGGGSRVPIVFNPNGGLQYPPDGNANSVLAGGNFYWVAHDGDVYGHNVYGISGIDSNLSHAPGGFTCNNSCHMSLATPSTGCTGCHVPHHHKDDGVAGVTGEGDGWYRFLGDPMGSSDFGVTGIEDPNWEQNPTKDQHNVYKGTTTVYIASSVDTTGKGNAIGAFCSGCHSKFHDAMNNAQPGSVSGDWIRHPSDVALPNSGEYSGYNNGTDIYNPLAPVAKPDLSVGVTDVVVPGTDIVMCLSCHRPHGSPYPDMLRWDYPGACVAGTANSNCGCFVCHSTKDDE